MTNRVIDNIYMKADCYINVKAVKIYCARMGWELKDLMSFMNHTTPQNFYRNVYAQNKSFTYQLSKILDVSIEALFYDETQAVVYCQSLPRGQCKYNSLQDVRQEIRAESNIKINALDRTKYQCKGKTREERLKEYDEKIAKLQKKRDKLARLLQQTTTNNNEEMCDT